ncbi:hypothetical protein H2198_002265 [Neophaeococcomyces mojaviensis]|uniref:Uncharacterized protein n=1 Tax=Neophaeococcomyces mojaviensis TaxID=3383035 RepID=A0ACC3AF24_9EURO|nr:hypothetical protein H2198_002265 [Knufia sp. JES_112]
MESSGSLENTDIYEFLGLPGPASTESEIRKAGRKTSLLYHPDKVAPTPENLANFHLVQQALAILTDSAEKSKYDQTREAKLRRKAEVDALDARRRKMREDLEAREKNGVSGFGGGLADAGGQKRTFSQREMDIRRIQEENRAKMATVAAKRRAEAEGAARVDKAAQEVEQKAQANGDQSEKQEDVMERNIRLRWVREGAGAEYDEHVVQDILMDRGYGGIESTVLLRDKKRKVDGKKVMLGTAVVIFETLEDARRLLKDKGKLIEFETIEAMSAGKEA